MSKAKSVKEVLIAARWIIDNVGWCQLSYFQTKNGDRLSWSVIRDLLTNSDIRAVCAIGAIQLVDTDTDVELLQFDAENLLNEMVGCHVVFWNDDASRTKQEVLDLYDRAIERA